MRTSFETDIPSTNLTTALSCKNCSRLIEIEGESLCYWKGQVASISQMTEKCNNVKIMSLDWMKVLTQHHTN